MLYRWLSAISAITGFVGWCLAPFYQCQRQMFFCPCVLSFHSECVSQQAGTQKLCCFVHEKFSAWKPKTASQQFWIQHKESKIDWLLLLIIIVLSDPSCTDRLLPLLAALLRCSLSHLTPLILFYHINPRHVLLHCILGSSLCSSSFLQPSDFPSITTQTRRDWEPTLQCNLSVLHIYWSLHEINIFHNSYGLFYTLTVEKCLFGHGINVLLFEPRTWQIFTLHLHHSSSTNCNKSSKEVVC